ncbi:TIGR00289 family protein [Candidatus Bathyarchaeota archaeon]|nr:TIGR00289 family protein [Candidatus Bathyarchaeota archaeon]RJS68822.1 MAG: TIGR00289 family protein [Candidatus Bathyarchaeota archaeon]RLI16219.1 MAG: TIGR00289 family protein [Candidatus Bathyarchaeota archaeon]
MRVAVLATGGKDSILALHRVLNQGYKVECLVSMIPLREDSWMFHYPNIRLVDLVAEAVGLPLVKAETSGVKEEEVEDLERLIGKLDVEGVVSGAIASNYQKTRIDNICKELNIKSITPLWHEKPLNILKEILNLRFEVIITGVYAYGFDKEWLGRRINEKAVEELVKLSKKYKISLVGEGGEYETLVLDAPLFKKRIKILEFEEIWENQSGLLLVKKARLESKEKTGKVYFDA